MSESIKVESFELTDEAMAKAETYVPYMGKSLWIKVVAEKCLKDITITDKETKAQITTIKGEDLIQKNMFLLLALLELYFHISVDKKSLESDPYAVYDYYASKNIIGQLEKYRKHPEYGEKAFAILTDYKELKKLLDAEIYNLRNAYNDTIYRLQGVSSEFIKVMNSDEKAVVENE